MQPILLELGPLKIHSYGLMIAIGFLTALYFLQRDVAKHGYDPKVFADLSFILLPLGIAGARIAHIIMFPESYSWKDPVGWIAIWRGGLVFQGAPPIALAFAYFWLKRHGIPFWKGIDFMFPYVLLGHGIGRLGCFMNGCCYGQVSDVPWAIPTRRVPWDLNEQVVGNAGFIDHLRRFADVTPESHWSHPMHPTQLYSFAGLLLLFGLMLLLRKYWHPFAGFTMPAYFVLYGLFRFVVEFYRGDHNPVHVLGLSDQQMFSITFAGLGVVLFVVMWMYARPKGDPDARPESGN